MSQLNGCAIEYSYDKLSKKCRSCINKDYCDHKSKEKYGALALPDHTETKTELRELSNAMAKFGVSAEDAADSLKYLIELAPPTLRNNGGSLF